MLTYSENDIPKPGAVLMGNNAQPTIFSGHWLIWWSVIPYSSKLIKQKNINFINICEIWKRGVFQVYRMEGIALRKMKESILNKKLFFNLILRNKRNIRLRLFMVWPNYINYCLFILTNNCYRTCNEGNCAWYIFFDDKQMSSLMWPRVIKYFKSLNNRSSQTGDPAKVDQILYLIPGTTVYVAILLSRSQCNFSWRINGFFCFCFVFTPILESLNILQNIGARVAVW